MKLSGKPVLMFLIVAFSCFFIYPVHAFNQADLQKLNTTNSCVKCDLANANLANMDMYGANLAGANLSGANLSKSALEDADLRGANLKGANISGTSFSGAKLSGTIWTDGNKCKAGSMGKCK